MSASPLSSTVLSACAAVAGAFLLSACGGQDLFFKTPPPAAITLTGAEGLYSGTTNTGRTLTALVLEDGTHYVFYSAINQPTLIRGFLQGTGVSLNGSYTSSNSRDLNIEGLGVLATTISASYVQKKTFNGNWNTTTTNQTATFTTNYDTAYESKPALDIIAGTFNGTLSESTAVAGGAVTNLTISATGAITMTNAPCTGTAAARAKGNLYTITLSCNTPAVAFTGIGQYDATSRRLLIGTMREDRANGRLFVGTKL